MLVYAPTFVGTTNQTPATPSPFAWPGALSPEKVYSGCPLYSTWLPLALATTVSFPGSVVEVAGMLALRTGGQAEAQPPLQTELAVSEVR